VGGEQVPIPTTNNEKTEEEGLTFSEWKQKVLAEAEQGQHDGNTQIFLVGS